MSLQMCRRLGAVAGRRYTLWSGILGWGAGAPSPVTCPTRSGVCSPEARMNMVRHHLLSNQKAQQAVCSAYWQLSRCAGSKLYIQPEDPIRCACMSGCYVGLARLHALLNSVFTSQDTLSISTYTALQSYTLTSCMLHSSLHFCVVALVRHWGPILSTSLSVHM